MQRKSEYKTCCGKFKRLGDGIQTDCIADDGYTWDFYFCNEPVDKEMLAKGNCPMHCCLLHMYGNLQDSGHGCKMDNLFNSVKLVCSTYSLDKPVLIHGVLRKSGRGAPPCIMQEEQTGKWVEAARGTVIAAVLKGDSQSSNLVIASCYDQKPFYMISHSIEEVTWIEHTKQVWSSVLRRKVDFKFLWWALSDDYNYEMNDNDVADQLCLVYRIMRLQRNNKWWWALWLWGYKVIIVNLCCMCLHFCILSGVKMPWTHHDWNEAITYAHINPDKEWRDRKSPTKLPVVSTGTDYSTDIGKRCPKFDSAALLPTRGGLNCLLNHEMMNHMPIPPPGSKDNHVCQLH